MGKKWVNWGLLVLGAAAAVCSGIQTSDGQVVKSASICAGIVSAICAFGSSLPLHERWSFSKRTLYSIHLLPHVSLPFFKLWHDDLVDKFGIAIGIAIPFILIQIIYQHRPAGRAQSHEYFGYPIGDLKLTEARLPRRESINDIVALTFTRLRNKSLPETINTTALGTTNLSHNVAPRGEGVDAAISMDDLECGLIAQEERAPPSVCGRSVVDIIKSVPTIFCNVRHNAPDLIPTPTTVKAEGVAKLFFDQIYELHGLPKFIVSDRDTRFTRVES